MYYPNNRDTSTNVNPQSVNYPINIDNSKITPATSQYHHMHKRCTPTNTTHKESAQFALK